MRFLGRRIMTACMVAAVSVLSGCGLSGDGSTRFAKCYSGSVHAAGQSEVGDMVLVIKNNTPSWVDGQARFEYPAGWSGRLTGTVDGVTFVMQVRSDDGTRAVGLAGEKLANGTLRGVITTGSNTGDQPKWSAGPFC